MVSLLCGAGLAVAGVFSVVSVMQAGPALAGPCSPNLAINPVPGSPPSAAPVISGTASPSCADGSYQLSGPVQLSISAGADPGSSTVPKADLGFSAPVSAQGTWSSPLPAALAYNGSYQVTATVNASGVAGPESNTASANFSLAVPPATPTGVGVTPIAGGGYHVAWSPNPEPDLTDYVVQRSTDTGAAVYYKVIACGARGSCATTFSDTGASPATTYTYRVSAVRYGKTQAPGDLVESAFSPAVSTASPSNTGAGSTPGPGGAPGGSPGSGATPGAFTGPPRYVSAGSGFSIDPNSHPLSGAPGIGSLPDPSVTPPSSGETGAPTAGGFSPYLPYSRSTGVGPGGLVAESGPNLAQARSVKVHQLSSIALALILVAVAGEMLGLRRRMLEGIPIQAIRARSRAVRRSRG
ncbi:MAG: hypothetical protein ACRD0I_07205 [Acidimicrobiales bacterium]